jgi:hypothetical protein
VSYWTLANQEHSFAYLPLVLVKNCVTTIGNRFHSFS